MVRFRGRIPDFELANPIYVGVAVTFYEADSSGVATSTLATLYSAAVGATTVSNPQTLDSEGKLAAPVFIDTPVIASVTGALAGPHTTGAIAPRGTHKGDWATATRLSSGDTVRDATTGSLYAASNDFTTSATLAADVSADDLEIIVDASQILTDLTASFANAIDLAYTFSATTTMADPGAGIIRLNNGTLASVTAIALDDATAATGNPDASAYLATFDDSTAATKGHLLIRKPSAPENFAIFAVTGLTDNSGWVELAVTHVASSGSFSASDVMTASFFRAGDKGLTVSLGPVYDFATNTSMADPSAGNVRLNNATLASVTAIAIHDTSASPGNPDVSAFLLSWDDSTASNKGWLTIKRADAPENFAIYQLSSLTDNTTWIQFNVSHIASAGSFSASDEVSVEFIPTVGATASAPVQDVAITSTINVIDAGKLLRATAAVTYNLTAAATLGDGWYCFIFADGGAVTIDPSGSETVNGETTLVVLENNGGILFCAGSAFYYVDTSSSGGLHLNEVSAAPATSANQGAFYAKAAGGQTELFFREESDGDEVQVTSGGSIFAGLRTIQVFTSGSGTYNTPTSCRAIRARLVGGGGGAGDNTAAGSAGGNSTFSTLTASGGAAGPASGNNVGGGGGSASGGDLNIQGERGGPMSNSASGLPGGQGGSSVFGGGGGGAAGNGAGGQVGSTNSGGGGGGISTSGGTGSAGGGGGGYLEKMITGPSATYSYAVGAGGAGGGGTPPGGEGAAGIIIIEEFY